MRKTTRTFCSLLLTLAFILTTVSVPAAATKEGYQYKTVSFEVTVYYYDSYENDTDDDYCTVRFTFDKAAVGYEFAPHVVWGYAGDDDDYSYLIGGEDDCIPRDVVVLKDNSSVKVEILEDDFHDLPAGYVDAHSEYALHEVSSDGIPVLNTYDVEHEEENGSHYRRNPIITSGSISQFFNPKDGKTVAVRLGEDAYWKEDMLDVWLVQESDAEAFQVRPAGNAQTAASAYQSTAKLTEAMVVDMDYNSFNVTVTNPTNTLDRGTVALVLASDEATVHFIDYEVAPNSSRTYSVGAIGHMGSMGNYLELISGVEKYLNATIITFESDEDVADFKASIPREARGHHYDNFLSQNDDYGAITVCFGTPGDSWLKMAGISRKSAPYLYEEDNHTQCKA